MRLTASLFLLLSCGEKGGASESLTIDYQLFKRGENVACGDASEVREIEVTLFGENGITPRAGWPRKSDCSGNFAATVEAGAYVLQVVAIGELQGDPNAVLYKARSPISVPGGSLSLSLQPEVAFLDLSWTFGDTMLAPCATEVATVDVLVSAGSDPFNARFACNDTPIRIEQPFSLQSYTIQVRAYSSDEYPLFIADAQKTLDRGQNDYTAVLRPLGGQVTMDFAFLAGPVPTRFCDDPMVNAADLTASIKSLEGDETVTETFSCMEPRPYAFKKARFTQGRQLELELVADADARFKGIQPFTMPAGDYFTGIMTLVPVGSGEVVARVESSTCTADVERFDVTVRLDGVPAPLFEGSIMPPADRISVVDLPYATYAIEVQEIVGDQVHCSAEGMRTIDARTNDWDPFVF